MSIARAIVRDNAVDCVLLDIRLRDGDGLDYLRELREGSHGHIPVIVATAYGDSELLQWLDGNHQVNKSINLASTNYPEKLDRRITSRPRRFDRILRIDNPNARLRAAYFARKLTDPRISSSRSMRCHVIHRSRP